MTLNRKPPPTLQPNLLARIGAALRTHFTIEQPPNPEVDKLMKQLRDKDKPTKGKAR